MMRLCCFCHGGAAISLAAVLVLALPATLRVGWAEELEQVGLAHSPADLETRIGQLIQQLGAPQYATRQKAKAELERLRLDAFDALNEAQLNDDIEIALSARYLVRSMQVNWWTDEDSPEVKQLLRDYGSRQESERRNLMEQLAGLPPDKCLRPLCRLVRYEASEHLSKRAALLILSLNPPAPESERAELGQSLVMRVGKSKREAANWLRAYADLLVDAPTAIERWDELVAAEEEQLALNPNQTGKELTRDLLKWFADQLSKRDRRDEAMVVMRKTINLLNTSREEVLDAVEWFRERDSWTIIVEIADRFPDTFKRNPMLQYRLAETYMKLEQPAKAEEIARLAMQSVPAELDKHLEIAFNLQHDGLFEWAELELRHVAEQMDEEPVEAIRAQISLAEMLHELGKEQEAGDVLRKFVDIIDSQEEIRELLETDLGRDVGGIKSRMHFFIAAQHGKNNDFERQREELLEGLKNDPNDADVLIAMHRVAEADDAWKEETRRRIKEAAEHFRQEIRKLTAQAGVARPAEDRALAVYQLALSNNQLAWLIANTEGDFDESLQCSIRSLELRPNQSGFLDTLGRCFYAKGDYQNAVKYQLLAVAQEPHSPPMTAQLKLFQEALKQQQNAAQEKAADQQDATTMSP